MPLKITTVLAVTFAVSIATPAKLDEPASRVVKSDGPKSLDATNPAAIKLDHISLALQAGADYESGQSGKKDLRKAKSIYLEAALDGSPEAQFRLARTIEQLARGRDTSKLGDAISWYEEAARHGHKEAQQRLQNL